MIILTDDEAAIWEFQDFDHFQRMVDKYQINLKTSTIKFRAKLPAYAFESLQNWLKTAGGQIL